jgi:hypothetical protein
MEALIQQARPKFAAFWETRPPRGKWLDGA